MNQEPIFQRKQESSAGPEQPPLQCSGFEDTNVSASEPAFQLQASSSAPVQRSADDTMGKIQQNAQEKFGVDVSGVQLNKDVDLSSVGAVGTYQAGGAAQRQAATGTINVASGAGDSTVAHEYGHAIRNAQGYNPSADTSVGGQGVDSNVAEERRADSIGDQLLA